MYDLKVWLVCIFLLSVKELFFKSRLRLEKFTCSKRMCRRGQGRGLTTAPMGMVVSWRRGCGGRHGASGGVHQRGRRTSDVHVHIVPHVNFSVGKKFIERNFYVNIILISFLFYRKKISSCPKFWSRRIYTKTPSPSSVNLYIFTFFNGVCSCPIHSKKESEARWNFFSISNCLKSSHKYFSIL